MFKISEWHEVHETLFQAIRQGCRLIGRVWTNPDGTGCVAMWVIKGRYGEVLAADVTATVVYPDRQAAIDAMCTAADAAFRRVCAQLSASS